MAQIDIMTSNNDSRAKQVQNIRGRCVNAGAFFLFYFFQVQTYSKLKEISLKRVDPVCGSGLILEVLYPGLLAVKERPGKPGKNKKD